MAQNSNYARNNIDNEKNCKKIVLMGCPVVLDDQIEIVDEKNDKDEISEMSRIND